MYDASQCKDANATTPLPPLIIYGNAARSEDSTDVTLLTTANMNIYGTSGRTLKCRALPDTSSMINFITEAACKRLKIKPQKRTCKFNHLGNHQV